MVKVVQYTVVKLGLQAQGFTEEQLGSHSLRAGGEMVLNLNRVDGYIIKMLSR